LRTAQQQRKRAERNIGKGRQLLVPRLETQVLGVERHGASNVLDVIADTVEFEHKAPRFLHGNVIARRHA
jgi:hypothetical protein